MSNNHPILPDKAFRPWFEEETGKSSDHAFLVYGANGEYDPSNELFNIQSECLLDKLNRLCIDWDISEEVAENLASFKMNFLQRYYNQSIEYYSDVKFWLEELYLLLESEKYLLEDRKASLSDFLKSLIHCAPSVNTRIQEVIMMLRGPTASGVREWLALFRTEIIASLSAEFCESLMAPTRRKILRMENEKSSIAAMEDPSEWHITRLSRLEYDILEEKLVLDDTVAREIHYQKYFLSMSSNLGWNPVIQETVMDVEEAKISHRDETWFKDKFCRLYSPATILMHIAEKMTEAVQKRLRSLLPEAGASPLIVPVKNLGEISSHLDGLPLVNELPESLDWLLYSIETPDPGPKALGFRFAKTDNYYRLARPVENLALHIARYFWSWLVREDSPWFRPLEDSLLTSPDETGIRYFILPYAPKFCYAITPDNQWFPLDSKTFHDAFPSLQPFWIAPVSSSEAADWGLELTHVPWNVFLNYIHNGKTDFRDCPVGNPIDLRGAPLSLAKAVLVMTDGTKTLSLHEARWIFVEENVTSFQALRDIVLGMTNDTALNIMDDEGDPDPRDSVGTAFTAFFRSRLISSKKLSQFFEAACFGEGYTKKNLYLTSSACPDDACLFCLAFALRNGRYPDSLTVSLRARTLQDHEVELFASILSDSTCQKGLLIRFLKTDLTPFQVHRLIDTLQSGHFPEGGGFALQIPERDQAAPGNEIMTHLASTLTSGRCPSGLRLRLSGYAFGMQHGIDTLIHAVASKSCPDHLHLDFTGSLFTVEALAGLVQALKHNHRPPGLNIRLLKASEDDRLQALQDELQSLLNLQTIPFTPSPPQLQEEEVNEVKEMESDTSWAQFFSPPRRQPSGGYDANWVSEPPPGP